MFALVFYQKVLISKEILLVFSRVEFVCIHQELLSLGFFSCPGFEGTFFIDSVEWI